MISLSHLARRGNRIFLSSVRNIGRPLYLQSGSWCSYLIGGKKLAMSSSAHVFEYDDDGIDHEQRLISSLSKEEVDFKVEKTSSHRNTLWVQYLLCFFSILHELHSCTTTVPVWEIHPTQVSILPSFFRSMNWLSNKRKPLKISFHGF